MIHILLNLYPEKHLTDCNLTEGIYAGISPLFNCYLKAPKYIKDFQNISTVAQSSE